MTLTREEALVDIAERLNVMRVQERRHYAVPDYLAADYQKRLRDEAAKAELEEQQGLRVSPTTIIEVPEPEEEGASSAGGQGQGSAQQGSSNGTNGDGAPQAGASSTGSSTQINEVWREKICEWFYQVVDHFDFNREVVAVAATYLDRYLATRAVNRRIFQLAAMAALYLAIKLFEPGKLKMSSLIELSRGYFLAEHIVTMEDSMIQSLGWHVHPPTPFAYCRDLATLLPEDISPVARHDVAELARFLTELSVCDYDLAIRRPSSVALACMVNAIELQAPRVRTDHKAEFLRRVVELGLYEAVDNEIHDCYERIRETYVAGGYAPPVADEEDDKTPETDSPNAVDEGPDVPEGHMECV